MLRIKNFSTLALLALMVITPSTLAALAEPGMPEGLVITENFDPDTDQGYYAVQNNTADSYLEGFGVSNPLSEAFVGSYGSGFGCNFSWCYGSHTLNAGNWDTEIADFNSNATFLDLFGEFSNNVEDGESTINWYGAIDGALGPGDFEDFFLFGAAVPASLALGILSSDTDGTTYFNQAGLSQVPLPAAAWLLGSALLGLGIMKRQKA